MSEKLGRNVAILASGTVLGQIATVVASPILTRLYTPHDFGVVAAFVSLLSLLSTNAGMRYEFAIALPRSEARALRILVLSLLVMCASLLLLILIILAALYTSNWGKFEILRSYIWLLPIAFVAVGAYQILSLWGVRRGAYGVLARTKLWQGWGMVITQIGLGSFSIGAIGLILGQIVGQGAGVGSLLRLIKRDWNLSRIRIKWRPLRLTAIRYKRFPLIASGAALLNTVGAQAPVLFLVVFYNATTVGWLALCQKILRLPLSFISRSVGMVYLGDAAKVRASAPHELKSLFWKTTRNQLLIGAPIVGVIALPAPLLFPFVFGATWKESGQMAALLAVPTLIQFASSPVSNTLDVLERQDLILAGEIATIILSVTAVAYARYIDLSAIGAIMLFSVGSTLGGLVAIWLSLRAINTYVKTLAI